MRWLRNLFTRPAPEAATAMAPAVSTPPAAVIGWDAWRARAPEGPVAVALDLTLEKLAPDPSRPRLLRVSYPLLAAGPDGLPTAAEGERLARAEDALSEALGAIGATYAGRVTLAGIRTHLFYLTDGVATEEALAASAPGLSGYQVTSRGQDDPAWRGWCDELLPPPRTRRWIEDRREVEALARHGDHPERPRPVDHQASFPTTEAREAFTAEAATLGFAAADRRDDAPPPAPYAVDLRRVDPVTLRHIHGVSWSLSELATRHGGGYDGWEPSGVA